MKTYKECIDEIVQKHDLLHKTIIENQLLMVQQEAADLYAQQLVDLNKLTTINNLIWEFEKIVKIVPTVDNLTLILNALRESFGNIERMQEKAASDVEKHLSK